MDKRPLAVIAVFFIIGIVLGRFFQDHIRLIQVFYAAISFIIATIICVRFSRIAHTFLFLSIISLGSLLYLNSNIFPPNHISHFLGRDKIKAEIIGVIKSPAEARNVYYGKVNSRYVFELEDINGSEVAGLALIRIQTEKDYQYGDRLRVKGTIKRPDFRRLKPAATNNGDIPAINDGKVAATFRLRKKEIPGFNYREYLENQNILAIINASEKNVTLLARNYKVNPVVRFAYFVREKLKNQFLEKMPLESGEFLRAILLGDRSELPKKLNESFRNSGTMHILPNQNTKKLNYSS